MNSASLWFLVHQNTISTTVTRDLSISTMDSATQYKMTSFFFFFTLFFLTRLFVGNVANPTGCENNGPFWVGHFPRWAGPPDPPRPTHDGGVCVKVTRDQQVKHERGKKCSESLPVGRNNMAESSGCRSGRLKKKGQRHKRRAERKRCTAKSHRH